MCATDGQPKKCQGSCVKNIAENGVDIVALAGNGGCPAAILLLNKMSRNMQGQEAAPVIQFGNNDFVVALQ